MARVTYSVVVKRAPDENVELPTHPNDLQVDGISGFDEACRQGERLYAEACAADGHVPFKAYVYEVGPRGGHHARWDFDARGLAGGWAWIKAIKCGRGWM